MRGGRHERRDVREIRSKNRFQRLAQLDPDIQLTRQDDDDSEPSVHVRVNRQSVNTINRQLTGHSGIQRMGGNNYTSYNRSRVHIDRRKELAQGSAAGLAKDSIMVFQIKVKNGNQYGINWIFKQLGARIEDFKPVLPEIDQNHNASFYVKDAEQAEAICAFNRRIRHKETGSNIQIWKNEVVAPWRRLSASDVDLLNSVIDSRYNQEARALDLSEFSTEKRFTENNKLFRLTSNQIMLHVLDRIDQLYGHLTALSLKGNKIDSLDCTSMLLWATKFVKVLDLSSNAIKSMEQVSKLKGLPVEMIFLEGNPLCDEYTSNLSLYLSAVHSVFPRVNMLDGNAVTPVLTGPDPFDVGVEPPFRAPYFGDQPQIKDLIMNFLLKFYEIYDCDNPLLGRKKLGQAYDENESMFTLTVQNLADSQRRYQRARNEEAFHSYLRQSHNLKQVEKWDAKRAERVHVGAMSIAVALSKLPRTNHIKETFTLDVSLVMGSLMAFSVSGLFEDEPFASPQEPPELRYFTRQFVVAPRGTDSLVVISDMLFITTMAQVRINRFKQQFEKSQKNVLPRAPDQPAPIAVQSVAGVSSNVPAVPELAEAELKRQMIEQFSQQSGMLPDWSEKCLVDAEWDYEQAGRNFLELRDNIPREAFA